MFKVLAIAFFVPSVAVAAELPDLSAIRGMDVPAMVEVADPIAPSVLTDGKIVGGMEAQKGEFPFIVSLRSSWGSHFCGGSLIKKGWVLTAAHCVEGGYLKGISIGLHNQYDTEGVEKFTAEKVITHPGWNSNTMENDFALVKLSGDSSFEPIKLNSREIGGSVNFVTAGWGTTSESGSLAKNLMKVTVPFIDQATCEAAYPGNVTGTMICAGYKEGGKDSCQGDSGGPLMMGYGSSRVLVGVVSWGYGCARPNQPGVYAKVNSAFDWIESNTK
ncbi:MAG: serine protease [Elusimicrobiales bacterium]|nr:serine protease [Elusimicrobiales bacterium]